MRPMRSPRTVTSRSARTTLPSVRADLLVRLGQLPEARAEFLRAAGMTRNDRERELLEELAAVSSFDPRRT